MNPLINELRLQFYAQTDVEITSKARFRAWQEYALWLEAFQAKKFRDELLKENNLLREGIHEVMAILETAVSSRI